MKLYDITGLVFLLMFTLAAFRTGFMSKDKCIKVCGVKKEGATKKE